MLFSFFIGEAIENKNKQSDFIKHGINVFKDTGYIKNSFISTL